MADKYLKLDRTTGFAKQEEAVTTGGVSQAGKIPALTEEGIIHPSMLSPVGITAMVYENVVPGDYVNIFYTSGSVQVRKSNATDATMPAHGYVTASGVVGGSVYVYVDGFNTKIPQGTLTTSDIGKRVFISTTPGGVTIIPPTEVTGRLVQCVGVIFGVVSGLVTVDTEINDGIVA